MCCYFNNQELMFYVSFDIFAKITKINRVAMSMKDAIRKMREEMEKQGGRREKLNNAIKKEINEFKASNMGQDECLDRLEEKRKIAEEKEEKDKANMYEIAIAILKDLWAKKMSEAEQKKLLVTVAKAGIEMQEFLQKSNIEKQTIFSKMLIENLKNRKVVLDNARKMVEENKNMLPFFEKSFGQIGKNIINQFDFENREINDIMIRKF